MNEYISSVTDVFRTPLKQGVFIATKGGIGLSVFIINYI